MPNDKEGGMNLSEVKAAAEQMVKTLERYPNCPEISVARFALAALPVIEAAEEYRKPLKTWTQQEQRQNDLDAALAKLREG
jgi:hypothetical protein